MKSPIIATLIALTALPSPAQTGPMVGTVKPNDARFLYRPGAVVKTLRLTVLDATGAAVGSSETTNSAADDYVAKFHVTGLAPERSYTYRIDEVVDGTPAALVPAGQGLRFRTPPAPGKKSIVTIGIASCARDTSEPIWQRMGELGVDQLLLGGDTPYVDTAAANLPTYRNIHRAFLETPFLAGLIRRTPTFGTWDDHDFGLNNGNGVNNAARRSNALKAFTEYRAHDQFGNGAEGVYHKLDLGPAEIFLPDPRWWSQTAASPVDPSKKTCYGAEQIEWIKQSLAASRAPFKLLVIGQIWQDKKNSENDDQFTYWYERDHILDFIRERKIPGVVLVGGDIHVSRHLVHRRRLDYDLHDFITSPAGSSPIPSLDVPHPDLEWSDQRQYQFLTITADTRPTPAVLTARFHHSTGGLLREVVIPYNEMVPENGEGLGRDLRAWWSFDGNMSNHAVTGSRFDATPVNGAALAAGGVRGQAVSFVGASQQYLRIGRQTLDDSAALPERAGRWPLDDNSAAHSVSLWCKPQSLPAHGGTARSFLLESALGGASTPAYHLSIGFRASATDPAKINLELHTATLQPAGAASTASPTPIAQGPFACELDRSHFTDRWAHVAMTFDSNTLRLYLDGVQVAAHDLPVPGPAAETAGLIIGGHREGTGRNFDGMIDEVALWSRVLTPAEIESLHGTGNPPALPTGISATDSDGDTLADWWETLYGLDPENPADPLADHDGDGVPAWLEKAAGTHPQIDDSSIYDYIREMVSTGGPASPTVFRHPSLDQLSFRISLESSDDLKGWHLKQPGTDANGVIETDRFQLSLAHPDSVSAFFRIAAEP